MILIVGGTSRLGIRTARLLRSRSRAVRIMTRHPETPTVASLRASGAEIVVGDLRDAASLAVACSGATQVLAAAHGFPGNGSNNPVTVDDRGNRALIREATRAGVERFVFISVVGVREDHEIDFFRIKFGVEEELRGSGLDYTIVRAAAFMESWAAMIGEPILTHGRATIVGRGKNPINFVAADDVAALAVAALDDQRAKGRTIEIGGPANYTLLEVAAMFEELRASPVRRKHLPLAFVRAMSRFVRPFNAGLSRAMRAGVYMDTADQRFEVNGAVALLPSPLTTLEDFVRTQYRAQPPA